MFLYYKYVQLWAEQGAVVLLYVFCSKFEKCFLHYCDKNFTAYRYNKTWCKCTIFTTRRVPSMLSIYYKL